VVPAGAITAFQIMGGLISPSAETLAVAHAAGVALGVGVAVRRLPLERFKAQQLLEFWRRHVDFPAWSLPSGLISAAAAQLPVLVTASRFGTETAGLLALAMRTLGAPTALLGASVLDVFKVVAAREYRDLGQCRDYYVRTLKGLAIGSLAVSIPLMLVSERLFAVAFGETWRGAGVIAVWLLPMFALRFVASPLSYMFFIARRQRRDLVWQIALLGMTLASLVLATSYSSALKSYSAGYSALYVVYLWMSYRLSCGRPG
jgi:O-antigen/teichoic acid export membrane protein